MTSIISSGSASKAPPPGKPISAAQVLAESARTHGQAHTGTNDPNPPQGQTSAPPRNESLRSNGNGYGYQSGQQRSSQSSQQRPAQETNQHDPSRPPEAQQPRGPAGMPDHLLMAFSDNQMSQEHGRHDPAAIGTSLSPAAQKIAYRTKLSNHLRSVYSHRLDMEFFYYNENTGERDLYVSELDMRKVEGFLRVLFLRARDENGDRMFYSVLDWRVLLESYDHDELGRVALEIFSSENVMFCDDPAKHESRVTLEDSKKP